MQEKSLFQQKYPLSPKKFWKKLVPFMIGSIFSTLFLTFFIGWIYFISYMFKNKPNNLQDIDFHSFIMPVLILYLSIYLIKLAIKAWYTKVYIRDYFYDCGDNMITIQKGVFSRREIHVQYHKIQDVYVDQDIFDRMFGLYDVHIASATALSGIEAHIDGVDQQNAEAIKNMLLSKFENNGSGNTKAEPKPAPMASEKSAPSHTTTTSTKSISSITYPIAPAWTTQMILTALYSSLFWVIVISAVLSSATKAFIDNGEFTIFLIAYLVVAILNILGQLLWKKNYSFEFSDNYIVMKTGILSRKEVHLPYRSIQDVTTTQNLLQRMLGLSNVVIENAAMEMVGKSMQRNRLVLVGQTYNKAQELTKLINDITQKNHSNGGAERTGV